MMRIPIQDIKLPDEYIRVEMDKGWVAQLSALYDGIAADAWPFRDKVLLRKLDKKTELDKGFEVVDGYNRIFAAAQASRSWVEADVQKMTDDEALIRQLDANLRHGKPLDPRQRDKWIQSLIITHKIPVSKIKDITRLSDAAISRAKTGKWAKGKTIPRKKAVRGKKAKKSKKGKKDKQSSELTWSVRDWSERLAWTINDYQEHKTELQAGKLPATLLNALRDMTAEFEASRAARD